MHTSTMAIGGMILLVQTLQLAIPPDYSHTFNQTVMSQNVYLRPVVLGSGDPHEDEAPDGVISIQETRPELAPPPQYKVLILNDDYTPMDFVVEVLEYFFGMDREKATRIMLTIHTEGCATAGIYTRDVAETKAAQVVDYAQQNQHPLLCQVEKA